MFRGDKTPIRRRVARCRCFLASGEGLENRELLTGSQALYGISGTNVVVLNPSTGAEHTYSGFFEGTAIGVVNLDN